ncbi:molybdenum cofactor guanylyltransferase MobA [Yersinia ruckeri]|uniref:Molybdenum cofactor guanylyltransferase n=1 Tax=Yersinia ruckeri TaxID=29486 RepID=A0A0A5FWF9_YERRU|nr:molybdenum cofactor guanylyltransferase MobA [Yersinia ruckeri]AUQ41527.1 molybdenum cofactor guanylyltransferase MobA [Yersinia ruckeri]EEP98588.1 molybdopterin-guanine dinucleotide biosynthesis protein A [Yersinia ruckeri ATCC 29473]EKN3348073.1 molybdenum cofactor guanylyltransferase MobA [Yersinia ruckeri]EKN3362918.1 molybdenum cofactor guanylyltransferase MobA [Yersinia ruckeri]EKN4199274.1 molybdenum cofactor guanylyltransferase MobA [Yersinia ruckeri]
MQPKITGIILAGGRATRMGGQDKGLINLGGKALFQRVANKLAPQVDSLLINANRNQSCYEQSGIPVFKDVTNDFSGPLAGMLAGLLTANTEWVVFAPCDVPDIPTDMVNHLWLGKKNALSAYVNDGERAHPTLALMHKSLAAQLSDYLASGERKLMFFLNQINAQAVIFNVAPHKFANLNTLEDCALWEKNNREHHD